MPDKLEYLQLDSIDSKHIGYKFLQQSRIQSQLYKKHNRFHSDCTHDSWTVHMPDKLECLQLGSIDLKDIEYKFLQQSRIHSQLYKKHNRFHSDCTRDSWTEHMPDKLECLQLGSIDLKDIEYKFLQQSRIQSQLYKKHNRFHSDCTRDS